MTAVRNQQLLGWVVVAVVVCYLGVLAAVVAIVLAGRDIGTLVPLLLGSLAPTIAVVAAVVQIRVVDDKVANVNDKVAHVDDKVTDLTNGVMDNKIQTNVHQVLDDRTDIAPPLPPDLMRKLIERLDE